MLTKLDDLAYFTWMQLNIRHPENRPIRFGTKQMPY